MRVQAIVQGMRETNDPPLDAASVMGFTTEAKANRWLLDNPRKAAAGIHFTVSDPTSIDFKLQLNTTSRRFRGEVQDPIEQSALPLQVAAHREVTRCAPTRARHKLPIDSTPGVCLREAHKGKLLHAESSGMCVTFAHACCRYHATQRNAELQTFDVGWKTYPHPDKSSRSVISDFLGLFLFAAIMFSFVSMVRLCWSSWCQMRSMMRNVARLLSRSSGKP